MFSKIKKMGIVLFFIILYIVLNKNYTNASENQEIKDGVYSIKSAMNTEYAIGVANNSKEIGANIELQKYEEKDSQKFSIKSNGNGYYTIEATHSNQFLDVVEASKNLGANVDQWPSNYGGANQQWQIKSAGNGYYYIISKCNDLYLEVEGGNCVNGANIDMWASNGGGSNQKFKIDNNQPTQPDEPVIEKTIEEGIYTIKSAMNTEYAIGVNEESKNAGANIELQIYEKKLSQKFKIEYNNGYYTIQALHSEQYFDVVEASKNLGANVDQWPSNYGGANQQWQIKSAGNGYYYIISKCNDLYLEVEGGNCVNGANIDMWASNGGRNNQKFKFEKTNEKEEEKSIEEGLYMIKSAMSDDFVIGVANSSKTLGSNVELQKNREKASQKFKIEYNNGYYTIQALHSEQYFDVVEASKNLGANVDQWPSNYGGANQQWQIKSAGNGYYYIISKCNDLYLEVEGGNCVNGANIDMWASNGGGNNQKFKFELTEKSSPTKIDETKYPGYKEKIEALQKAHPDWNFELLYTGLKFSEATAGESAVHSRNLVPTSYSGEWICSVCGTKLYDSGWYCASEKAIAYYLDPRNFLDEINIFQFQDVNEYLDEACTIEGIRNQVDGTFLQNYANDIETACRNTNVNPYYIIARLFQEQGRTGTTIGRGMDGGDGKTYYNPFNIGANGNGWETIYANALARAKAEGWDTMEKAIEGGIGFCKKNWLENYQNTLYQNRFDIDSTNGTSLYTHQYMQNLMGAYSEARILQSMYGNTNRLESSFTFIIPVYEQMDATPASMPSNTTESSPINVETTGTNVRLRAGASADSQIIMEIAEKGTVLLSIERGVNSDWQKVVLQDGTIGYVSGKFLKQINDVTTCNYTAKVKTNDGYGCNIRIGPGLNGPKLGALADGEQVTVIDNTTYKNIDGYDWYRIIIPDGRQAFIPGKYLK